MFATYIRSVLDWLHRLVCSQSRPGPCDSDRSTIAHEGRETVSYYLTLFVDDSETSQNAEELLKRNGFSFSRCLVRRDDEEFTPAELPVLITGDGRYSGYEAISLYCDYLASKIATTPTAVGSFG